MRDGKRYKSLYLLNQTLFNLSSEFKDLKYIITKTKYSWKDFYLTYNHLALSNTYNVLDFERLEVSDFGNLHYKYIKDIVTNVHLKTILFRNIHTLLPMFSFYIYKVDKQIFKNTRGKSGKYTFIWKYVTQYKRIFLVMYWLLKELRMMPGRTLRDRLRAILYTFIFRPNKTWIHKIKKFSNNYVYRNCRHTLAENYRTVTK